MKTSELEAAVLKLGSAKRARLAAKLLESLESLSDAETEQLWTQEAQRRDAELDADPRLGRPAKDAFRAARARLR